MDSTAGNLQPTKISIGGERIQVQTDLNSEELQSIISYIEGKMHDHLTPSVRAEPKKQLILMAMEITAELFATRARVAELEQSRERFSDAAEKLVDLLASEIEEKRDSAFRVLPAEDAPEAARIFLSPG